SRSKPQSKTSESPEGVMAKQALCILALAVVATAGGFRPGRRSQAAKPDGSPLAAQVVIRRDTYGIPHILAKTEEAAAFGFGYAQAEDHCAAIARHYVAARGEAAKYFGPGAGNEFTASDFLAKQFDNYEVCKQNFGQLDPLLQKIYNAYAAGLNHYVAQHRQELPDWIPVFDGVDALAANRMGSLPADGTINRLRQKYSGAAPKSEAQQSSELIQLPNGADKAFGNAFEQAGSNAFALAPSRTTSGKAILLGNPHLNWSSLYWEAQVTVPGRINFFGSTLAGIPVLRAGFNEHLGWVTTNNAPDSADVYALRLDPDKPDHYVFDGKSLPLTKKEVTVEVRGKDGAPKTERKTFEYSHLGPVIYRTKERAFAYRSTQLDSFRHFEGFYCLSKTRSLREWMDVMKLNLLTTSNFTYADAAGNILYLWNARLPKRVDDGTNYELDVPAETGKYVWQSLHPLADFPRLLNPAGGYTQNCNNPPWFASLRDPIDPDKYPSYFERGELALRPQLALEMLEGRQKFSLDDVKRLKFNDKMLLADRVKADLIKAVKAVTNPSEDLLKGLVVLEAWDNRAAAESKGTLLFLRFWDAYSNAMKQPFASPWDKQNPAKTPSGLADPAQAVKHFEEAVQWTRKTYGSEAVAWGEVCRYRF